MRAGKSVEMLVGEFGHDYKEAPVSHSQPGVAALRHGPHKGVPPLDGGTPLGGAGFRRGAPPTILALCVAGLPVEGSVPVQEFISVHTQGERAAIWLGYCDWIGSGRTGKGNSCG